MRDELGGYLLHEIDLAVNKVLALAGRDEPRDFVDVLWVHARILPLGALCWAAAGKDPGLSPRSLLELLKRRGRPRQEDLDRLRLTTPLDVGEAKEQWLEALEQAEAFVAARPPEELGCLYYSPAETRFVAPRAEVPIADQGLVPHFGSPGGVLPQPAPRSLAPDRD